jgi:hypothetical protein
VSRQIIFHLSYCLTFSTEMMLNKKNVTMNYINYDRAIVEKYKAKLVGWPKGLKFANPSAIGTVDDIRALRNALKTGECKWIALTKRQQAEHTKMLTDKQEAGEVVGKKRKERSDKGKKRDRKEDDVGGNGGPGGDGNDGPAPPKRQRKRLSHKGTASSKVLPTPKSKELIDDDEDDDDDVDETED